MKKTVYSIILTLLLCLSINMVTFANDDVTISMNDVILDTVSNNIVEIEEDTVFMEDKYEETNTEDMNMEEIEEETLVFSDIHNVVFLTCYDTFTGPEYCNNDKNAIDYYKFASDFNEDNDYIFNGIAYCQYNTVPTEMTTLASVMTLSTYKNPHIIDNFGWDMVFDGWYYVNEDDFTDGNKNSLTEHKSKLANADDYYYGEFFETHTKVKDNDILKFDEDGNCYLIAGWKKNPNLIHYVIDFGEKAYYNILDGINSKLEIGKPFDTELIDMIDNYFKCIGNEEYSRRIIGFQFEDGTPITKDSIYDGRTSSKEKVYELQYRGLNESEKYKKEEAILKGEYKKRGITVETLENEYVIIYPIFSEEEYIGISFTPKYDGIGLLEYCDYPIKIESNKPCYVSYDNYGFGGAFEKGSDVTFYFPTYLTFDNWFYGTHTLELKGIQMFMAGQSGVFRNVTKLELKNVQRADCWGNVIYQEYKPEIISSNEIKKLEEDYIGETYTVNNLNDSFMTEKNIEKEQTAFNKQQKIHEEQVRKERGEDITPSASENIIVENEITYAPKQKVNIKTKINYTDTTRPIKSFRVKDKKVYGKYVSVNNKGIVTIKKYTPDAITIEALDRLKMVVATYTFNISDTKLIQKSKCIEYYKNAIYDENNTEEENNAYYSYQSFLESGKTVNIENYLENVPYGSEVTISVPKSALKKCEVNNNTNTITMKDKGTVKVTINVTNADGYSSKYSFNVKVVIKKLKK